MSSVYPYSIVDDFGGNLNPGKFKKLINDSPDINKTCVGVNREDDDLVNITFNQALSTAEQTALNALIAGGHDSTPDKSSITVHVYPKLSTVSNSNYTPIGTFLYAGSQYKAINNVKVLSYLDNGATSYDIKVVDFTNNNTLCSGNFTNNSLSINDLGTISNIPTTDAIVEVQVRKTGGNSTKYVNIDSIVFYVK